MSIIIVGVGDEDFSAMEALDSDQGNLFRGIAICLDAGWSVVQVHQKALDNSFIYNLY